MLPRKHFGEKDAELNTWIREQTEDSNTVVELGAAMGARLMKCRPQARKIAIEVFPAYASQCPVDIRCVWGDMRNWERWITPSESDTAMLIDSIEHVSKSDGIDLILSLQSRFRKILVFTPDGFYIQTEDSTGFENEFQTHECGWTAPELEALGFKAHVDPIFHNINGHELGGAIFAVWERA